MKKLFLTIVLILSLISLPLSLSGCGSGGLAGALGLCDDCNDTLSDIRGSMGPPDDWDTYDAGDGYWTTTYWYWCSGIAYTVTQDGCNCDESTYTFSPICY